MADMDQHPEAQWMGPDEKDYRVRSKLLQRRVGADEWSAYVLTSNAPLGGGSWMRLVDASIEPPAQPLTCAFCSSLEQQKRVVGKQINADGSVQNLYAPGPQVMFADPPQKGVVVESGQWRMCRSNGGPYRVMSTDSDGDAWIRWLDNIDGASDRLPASELVRDRLATPREVLDAKLATLAPDQRERVIVGVGWEDDVEVDLVFVWQGNQPAARIDEMLGALDAALAKPVTQPAPNLQEEIRACGREPAEVRPAWLIRELRAQVATVTAERDRWKQSAQAAWARVDEIEAVVTRRKALVS